MRALVTGASGFIGGAVARTLVAKGTDVRVLLRPGTTPNLPDHAAVDLSVRLARGERRLQHAAGLVNAVLRRMARERLAEAG